MLPSVSFSHLFSWNGICAFFVTVLRAKGRSTQRTVLEFSLSFPPLLYISPYLSRCMLRFLSQFPGLLMISPTEALPALSVVFLAAIAQTTNSRLQCAPNTSHPNLPDLGFCQGLHPFCLQLRLSAQILSPFPRRVSSGSLFIRSLHLKGTFPPSPPPAVTRRHSRSPNAGKPRLTYSPEKHPPPPYSPPHLVCIRDGFLRFRYVHATWCPLHIEPVVENILHMTPGGIPRYTRHCPVSILFPYGILHPPFQSVPLMNGPFAAFRSSMILFRRKRLSVRALLTKMRLFAPNPPRT